MKVWRRYYKGWVITHDAYGALCCYWLDGPELRYCYFGSSMDIIKAEIDRREYLASLSV